MPRQGRYDEQQWEHMNREEAQLKLRGDLLGCVVRFLDTAPEGLDYTIRMADIVWMLKNYAKGERHREYDEVVSTAQVDSIAHLPDYRRVMLWTSAISALSDAEAGLRIASDRADHVVADRRDSEAFMALMRKEMELREQISDQDKREEKEWEAEISALWD